MFVFLLGQLLLTCLLGDWFYHNSTNEQRCSFVVVLLQSLSCVQLFVTPWTAALQASVSFTIARSLLKLLCRVSDAIQPSHPLTSPSPTFSLAHHQGLFQ